MREVIAGLGVIVETRDALTAVFAEFFLLAHVPHVALHGVTSSFPAFCSPLDFFGRRARLQGAVFFIIAVSGGNVNHGRREIPI